MMRRLLRPFILRRTKEEVARDLPRKTEQVIPVDLTDGERETYEEVRRYYRGSLIERIRRDGMQRSRMHVLEGLLRLRQAACHPGLLDPARRGERGREARHPARQAGRARARRAQGGGLPRSSPGSSPWSASTWSGAGSSRPTSTVRRTTARPR